MEKEYKVIQTQSRTEQEGIEQVSEHGTKESNQHKILEKDLQSELSQLSQQMNQLHHLIDSTKSNIKHWEKRAYDLHYRLQSIMELDKVKNKYIHFIFYAYNILCITE